MKKQYKLLQWYPSLSKKAEGRIDDVTAILGVDDYHYKVYMKEEPLQKAMKEAKAIIEEKYNVKLEDLK